MNQNKEKTHNGWSNYETWAVHLCLMNDRCTSDQWKKRTWEILGDRTYAHDDVPSAVARLADEIRRAIRDECAIEKTNLAADLMNAALERVDWCEIAQELIDDPTPPQSDRPGLFTLGLLVATPGAIEELTDEDRMNALARHCKGDWGDVCPEDWAENEFGIRDGCRLLSVYHSVKGVKFWIITEANRSATTLLLPNEY